MSLTVYNAAVAERFRRPPAGSEGTVSKAAISGVAGSDREGAVVRFFAAVNGDSLSAVGFRACACPHIIAACSLVAERLANRPVEALLDPAVTDALQELEIPVEKTGKILILQDALRACYADFESRRNAGAAG